MAQNEEDTRKLVGELLAGSARINQMKHEINALIKMIIGFLTPEERRIFGQKSVFNFESNGFCWNVWGNFNYISVAVGPKESGDYSYYTVWEKNNIPPQHTQAIHNGLPVFLEKMLGTFPGLRERLAPVKAAS